MHTTSNDLLETMGSLWLAIGITSCTVEVTTSMSAKTLSSGFTGKAAESLVMALTSLSVSDLCQNSVKVPSLDMNADSQYIDFLGLSLAGLQEPERS